MTTEDAKAYLANREIPQLFESLMTGLMYYRPEDHIGYLQECLKKICADGVDKVRWNLFIQSKCKTPLPPITPENGRARTPITGRADSFITDGPKSLEEKRGSPLPPIGFKGGAEAAPAKGSLQLPDCPIILSMGGPGSGKATQCKKILERYEGWVHLSMGDLLRTSIMDKGTVDEKWGMVASLVNNGELAPDEMTADLITENLKKNMNAKGIIIEGYPRNMEQVQEFSKLIGRVDLAFVLDCEEQYLESRLANRQKLTGRVDDNENAVEARIAFFREKTLPAIKHFDDLGKLAIVDGDRDQDEIFYDIATIFDNVFYKDRLEQPSAGAPAASGGAPAPRPPTSPRPKSGGRPSSSKYNRPSSGGAGDKATPARPGSGFSRVATMVDIKVKDTGRKAEIKAPIIFIMGGPGSGKSSYAKQLCERNDNYVHISSGAALRASDDARDAIMAGDMAPLEIAAVAVKEAMDEWVTSSTEAIVLEGFPRNQEQLEYFYEKVGGLNLAILVDVEEDYMRKNLDMNRSDANDAAIDRRIDFFKYETLPILGHLDDTEKLMVVKGDRDINVVFSEICSTVENWDAARGRREATMFSNRPASARIDPPDTGRKDTGIIKCPFFSIVGAPGSGVENFAKKVAEKYPKFAHVEMGGKSIADLEGVLPDHAAADGLIMENFPLDQEQVYDFNRRVGGLDLVIVLDCDEAFAKKNSSSPDVNAYKENTLCMLGYIDDRHRLEVIDIQKSSEEESIAACCKAIDNIGERPRFRGGDNVLPVISVDVADTGRKSALPSCHLISIISGPKGGADKICQKLVGKHAGSVHADASKMSADDVISKMSNDTPVVFLEGFPKDKQTLEQFNEKVGGMSGVVVIDTSSEFCKENGGSSEDIELYQNYTLPVLGCFDDFGRLALINGERPEDVVVEAVSQAVQQILSKSVNTEST